MKRETGQFPSTIAYLRHLESFDNWNQKVLLATLATMGWPNRYLDIGCGTGIMVRTSRALRIDAVGIDLLVKPVKDEPWLINHDLTTPIDLDRKFELITCIEVAEHIDRSKVDIFTENIERHMPVGGLLVFTAASPGQGGEHHNTLWPGYLWRTHFHEKYGISYRSDYTNRLRLIWSMIPMPMMWLTANLQVFDR